MSVMEPLRFLHTPKSARMMKSDCVITPQLPRAHDQKYRPRRRWKNRKSDTLSSAPIYHDIPANAAMVMAIGRSSVMAFIFPSFSVLSFFLFPVLIFSRLPMNRLATVNAK